MGSAAHQISFTAPPSTGVCPNDAGTTNPQTILLVDDNESLRMLALTVLEGAGYTVREAGSAEEAFALATKLERIDLLISDVIMPGASGIELGSGIASQHAHMSALYVSGYPGEEVFNDLATGEFLQKPFTMRALLAKVAELLAAA